MKRIRIEEFFHDFDKLRKGRVTARQFQSILSQLGFNLTNEEYAMLCEKYCDDSAEKFV
jgi:Ca2+-binding EF-hand superfamily protein